MVHMVESFKKSHNCQAALANQSMWSSGFQVGPLICCWKIFCTLASQWVNEEKDESIKEMVECHPRWGERWEIQRIGQKYHDADYRYDCLLWSPKEVLSISWSWSYSNWKRPRSSRVPKEDIFKVPDQNGGVHQDSKYRSLEKRSPSPLINGEIKIPSIPINAFSAQLQEHEQGNSDFIIFSSSLWLGEQNKVLVKALLRSTSKSLWAQFFKLEVRLVCSWHMK